MALLERLFELAFPAQRYIQAQECHPPPAGLRIGALPWPWRGSLPRGAAVYETGKGGQARAATVEELAELTKRASRLDVETILQGAPEHLLTKAQQCALAAVRHGQGHLEFERGQVQARLVRFWRGDHVLHVTSTDEVGASRGSLTVVNRRRSEDEVVRLIRERLVIEMHGRA